MARGNRARSELRGSWAALGLFSLLAASCGGEPTERATAFRDEAGRSCEVHCQQGSSGCAVSCEQAPPPGCGVNQTERWIAADLAWPDPSSPTLLVLCPACDDLYFLETCSPITCGAPQDCPFARHDCVGGRCQAL